MKLFGLMSILMASAGGGPSGGSGAALATVGGDSDGMPEGGGNEVVDAELVDDTDTGDQQASTALATRGEHLVDDSGRITKTSGKAVIDAVRAVDGRLANQVTQALIGQAKFRREFPGGWKDVSALRKLAEDNGGDEGIADLRADADAYGEIAGLFYKADPSLIARMTTAPDGSVDQEAKAALVSLFPSFMSSWKQLQPEGYAWHIANDIVKAMDASRLPVLEARVTDIINQSQADVPKALLVTAWNAFVNALGAMSYEAADASKKPQVQQIDNSQRDRDEANRKRESDLTVKEWRDEVGLRRKMNFATSLQALSKGKKIGAEDEASIFGWYRQKIEPKAQARLKEIDRYISRNDKSGFLRAEYAYWDKEVAEAVRYAWNKVFPTRQRTGDQQADTTNRGAQAQRPAPQQGVVQVRKMHNSNDIDYNRTTRTMAAESKYYGKDGRLYQFVR